jgi:hypothetical protein
MRFKSYPRVSQILLSFTSPGVSPYISLMILTTLLNYLAFQSIDYDWLYPLKAITERRLVR